MVAAYVFILIIIIVFYSQGFYENNNFFSWGVPIKIFGHTIDDTNTFNGLLTLFFFHQIINNWVNNVTYAWIITCVQNPKQQSLQYNNSTSLLIVNMFALYSEVDVILIIGGLSSQISFFVMIILANMVSYSFINWHYIRNKTPMTLLNLTEYAVENL
jgi:hypothetical protein